MKKARRNFAPLYTRGLLCDPARHSEKEGVQIVSITMLGIPHKSIPLLTAPV